MTWWVVCPPGEGQRETGAWEECVVCSVECWSVSEASTYTTPPRPHQVQARWSCQTLTSWTMTVMSSDTDIIYHIRHWYHGSWRSWRSCHQTLTSSHLHCDSHVIKHWHWCIIYSGNFISRFRVDKDTLDISIRSSIYIMETIYQVLV